MRISLFYLLSFQHNTEVLWLYLYIIVKACMSDVRIAGDASRELQVNRIRSSLPWAFGEPLSAAENFRP